ncbi:hypothetical protein VTK56DRAFT_1298 [Thermocarpiscus australiensis]
MGAAIMVTMPIATASRTTAGGGSGHDSPFFLPPAERQAVSRAYQDGRCRVLDIGTGTGIWAIQLGDDYPEVAEIVGNDLSPIQPQWCPPNVRFTVDNVELDWAEPLPYDFIYCSYIAGILKCWPRVVKQMYANTKPSGWVEFQESNQHRLIEACEKVGRHEPGAEEVGGGGRLRQVKEERFKMPIGSWPKDPTLKEIGTLLGFNFTEGVEAFTVVPFKDVLGWTAEEVAVLSAGVRAAVKKGDAHAMFDCVVATGQKPESG